MQVNKGKLVSGFIMLCVWCALLMSARLFSYWEWTSRWGTAWFEIGWIVGAVVVFCLVAIQVIRRKMGNVTPRVWFSLGVPFVLSEILRWKAAMAVQYFAASEAGHWLTQYAIYSSFYTLVIVSWIIVFPFDRIWATANTANRSVAWRLILIAVAISIAAVTCQHSFAIVDHYQSAAGLSGIYTLQMWMQSVTWALYIFLGLRVFLPVTVELVAAILGPKALTVPS